MFYILFIGIVKGFTFVSAGLRSYSSTWTYHNKFMVQYITVNLLIRSLAPANAL